MFDLITVFFLYLMLLYTVYYTELLTHTVQEELQFGNIMKNRMHAKCKHGWAVDTKKAANAAATILSSILVGLSHFGDFLSSLKIQVHIS